MNESEDRVARKKRLLEFYQTKPSLECIDSEQLNACSLLPQDTCSVDSSMFDSKACMSNLLKKCDLSDLMAKEVEVIEQIRSLDSEMQTLVYDNYNKFIYATHTIKMMKSDFKYIEDEMNSLAENLSEISNLSSKIDNETHKNRNEIKRLSLIKQSLHKLGYLSSLPTNLREYIAQENWSGAVNAYCKAKGVFEKFIGVPSFQGIYNDCIELINTVAIKVRHEINLSLNASSLSKSIETLYQLGEPIEQLSQDFIRIASVRISNISSELELEMVDRTSDINEEQKTTDSSLRSIKNNLVVVDILHFANVATDNVLNETLSYFFAYFNVFLLPKPTTKSADRVPFSKELLESALFSFLKTTMDNFFVLIKNRLQQEKNCTDQAILIRALERIYSRLKSFGRSVMEVAASEWTSISPGPSPNNSSSDLSNSTKQCEQNANAENFKQNLDASCLNLVLQVASICSKWHLELLKMQTADCLTDARQQLASFSLSSGMGSLQTDKCESPNSDVMEIYNNIGRTLVDNIRTRLSILELFLAPENTFSQIQLFRATFALEHIREGFVAAYLVFLIQFFKDLSKLSHSYVPSKIFLLTGKLSLDWANSGTIGHLLGLADDFLLIGLSKASTLIQPTQQALFKQMQSLLVDRQEPLTTPGTLTKEFRVTSTHLLTTFTKLEGVQMAHIIRKSIEARDWLKNSEPRSVRSVNKRVLEDLSLVDCLVGKLFPTKHRGVKDRVGSDSRSWQSRHLQVSKSHHSQTVSSDTSANYEFDQTLANQLRRLFFKRVDIFAPVEPFRESILLGIIKIGLKALVECTRTKIFGKFGLQQLQVDCHYLQIHLWKFVNDEKQIQIVLDDLMGSVIQRCIEPQLMSESIVDSLCNNSSFLDLQ